MAEGHVPIPWELTSLDDAIDVVPGLHLPWNVFGGDHRHPVRQVLQRQQRLSPEQLNRFWSNLIWIRDEFLNSTRNHERFIVHGHTPVPHPDIKHNRINIDTGAWRTGTLTCIAIEGSTILFL